MLNTLDKDAVNSFLKTCKKEIEKGNCYFAGYRTITINGKKKTAMQALLDLEITKVQHIWRYILKLDINDCVKVDRDRDYRRDMNSEVYIFKKVINNKIVYIKLTMNDKGIVCISFHESY